MLNERERREIGAAVALVEKAEAGARAAQAATRAPGAGAASKKLRAEADFTALRLVRLRPDYCASVEPQGTRVTFTFAEIGQQPTMPPPKLHDIIIVNARVTP